MLRALIVFFLFITTNCLAQKVHIPIKNWKPYLIPQNKDTLLNYNWSKVWWSLSIKGDEVYAYNRYQNDDDDPLPFKTAPTLTEKFIKIKGKRSVLKVDDGYLVGIEYGEWGGDLSWYSDSGGSHKNISGPQILQFLTVENHIYGLDGYGSIVEFNKIKADWQIKTLVKLSQNQNPISFALDRQNNFIVITNDCLLKIDKQSFVITKLIEDGFWMSYLYPTSMLIKNNVIYVGMRRGIFRYNLDTGEKGWLMPQ